MARPVDDMKSSKLTATEGDKVLSAAFRTLTIVGVLRDHKATGSGKIFSILRVFLGYLFHLLMFFRTGFDLFLIRNDVTKLAINLGMVGLVGGILIRNLLYLKSQNNIFELYQELRDGEYFRRDAGTDFYFMEAGHYSKLLGQLFLVCGLIAVPCWLIMPYLGEEFELPFRSWFPFEIKKYPNFYYAYGIQMASIGYMGVSIICCDLMTISILLLIRAHFCVLIKSIRDISLLFIASGSHFEMNAYLRRIGIRNRLKEIVEHHHHIIRFVKTFDRLFNSMLFITVVGGAVLITMFILEGLISSNSSSERSRLIAEAIVGTAALVAIYLYCFFGSAIETKSREVSEEVYNTEWYADKECGKDMRAFVILILNQSQKPQKVTAGKVVACSLPVFLSIMENVYNALAVFTHMLKDESAE